MSPPRIKRHTITYASYVQSSHRSQLEKVFFFNPSQCRYHDRIVAAIEAFSKPVLVVEDDKVMLAFEQRAIGQGLHILEERPAGAVLVGALLYTRDRPERLTVAHMGLRQCSNNDYSLIAEVYAELRRIARQIRGIHELYFVYKGATVRMRSRLEAMKCDP